MSEKLKFMCFGSFFLILNARWAEDIQSGWNGIRIKSRRIEMKIRGIQGKILRRWWLEFMRSPLPYALNKIWIRFFYVLPFYPQESTIPNRLYLSSEKRMNFSVDSGAGDGNDKRKGNEIFLFLNKTLW